MIGYHQILNGLLAGMIGIIALMLIRVFKGPTIYDRLNGIFALGADVIIVLLIIGDVTNRQDMYIDIALSYGLLGFLSTVIIAKFLSGDEEEEDD